MLGHVLELSGLIETFECLLGTEIFICSRRGPLGVSLLRRCTRQQPRATACVVLCEANNRADNPIGSRDADGGGGHTFRQQKASSNVSHPLPSISATEFEHVMLG